MQGDLCLPTRGSSQMVLPPVGERSFLPTALGQPAEKCHQHQEPPSPPATWKACGCVSTFAQTVLKETKCLIAQKIWCWQLANKLLSADKPTTPLLLGSNYPITQPFSEPWSSHWFAKQPRLGHTWNTLGLQGTLGYFEAKRQRFFGSPVPPPKPHGNWASIKQIIWLADHLARPRGSWTSWTFSIRS